MQPMEFAKHVVIVCEDRDCINVGDLKQLVSKLDSTPCKNAWTPHTYSHGADSVGPWIYRCDICGHARAFGGNPPDLADRQTTSKRLAVKT